MDSDKIAFEVLTKIGIKVSQLPARNDRKEADFIGIIEDERYIIEAKLKTDDSDLVKEKEQMLSSGESHVAEGSLGRDEAISTIIRSGAHQLRSSAKIHDHDYKILFVLSEGINSITKSDNLVDTLYGRTRVMNMDNNRMKPCYFFYHAELYRRKDDIDAVIEGYIDYNGVPLLQLCLNPYSKCYDALRSSLLSNVFGKAVTDPYLEESKGACYLPDVDKPRSKPADSYLTPLMNPMLLHLREKYKTGYLIALDFDSPEITVRETTQPES